MSPESVADLLDADIRNVTVNLLLCLMTLSGVAIKLRIQLMLSKETC